MPRMTCYTYTCLCPPSGFSCNQKNLSYISYVSVLFRGAHAPTKPCYDTSLRIRSLSGCLCVHEDPSFVCTYSVGLSACGVVCPHFGGTIGDEELPRSAVAPPSATLSYGMPVPVPLSKLTRACPSNGCFYTCCGCGAHNTLAELAQRSSKPHWRRTAVSRKRPQPKLSLALLDVVDHV